MEYKKVIKYAIIMNVLLITIIYAVALFIQLGNNNEWKTFALIGGLAMILGLLYTIIVFFVSIF